MLNSEAIFGKKDKTTPTTPPFGATAKNPFSPANSSNSTANTARAMEHNTASSVLGSQLIVGPNIKLKGVEINDCDTLVVEGRVEATIDARVIKIAESGVFKGATTIDRAEIYGEFSGDLTVRDKLIVHATGRVTGKIVYGKLVIEEGGQLNGDVRMAQSNATHDATNG
jgi:cytoskeletal protein CcmA (bactofilin family)